MTERLTIHVEDGTRDRLLKLADGHERKLGAVVSELAKQAEALQALKEALGERLTVYPMPSRLASAVVATWTKSTPSGITRIAKASPR